MSFSIEPVIEEIQQEKIEQEEMSENEMSASEKIYHNLMISARSSADKSNILKVEDRELYNEGKKFFESLKDLLKFSFDTSVLHVDHTDGSFKDDPSLDNAKKRFEEIMETVTTEINKISVALMQNDSEVLKKVLKDAFNRIKPILDDLMNKKTALEDCLESLKISRDERVEREKHSAKYFGAWNVIGFISLYAFIIVTIVTITPLAFILTHEEKKLSLPVVPSSWWSSVRSSIWEAAFKKEKNDEGKDIFHYDPLFILAVITNIGGVFSLISQYLKAEKHGLSQHFQIFLEFVSLYCINIGVVYTAAHEKAAETQWKTLQTFAQFVPSLGYMAYRDKINECIQNNIPFLNNDNSVNGNRIANAGTIIAKTSKKITENFENIDLNQVILECIKRKANAGNLMVALHQVSCASKYKISRLKALLTEKGISERDFQPLALTFGSSDDNNFDRALVRYEKKVTSDENGKNLHDRILLGNYGALEEGLNKNELIELLLQLEKNVPNSYFVTEPSEP